MIINHNLAAMNTYNQMGSNQLNASKNMEKLSSGLRINNAADDAAGLSISEKMRAQIRGLDQASRNAQDGISLLQTAEGGLNEAHSILQRMRELSVQATNDTNITEDRDAIQTELNELTSELGTINTRTAFNKQNLLDATAGSGGTGSVTLQVGANTTETMVMDFSKKGINLNDIVGTDLASLSVADATAADTSLQAIETAIQDVSAGRSQIGAYQNRLEHTINNLGTSSENLTAAESRVRDVDMAKEMMEFTKNNILNQASQAMLSQANQQPQAVLQLLR
ncbi:flagellin [Alkalihalobacillus hwajinpoensis]|uniref:flagellin N-terminal helical domain-containing protein n=1 Tax=Guptibacillus hwajinpoensis TaxID=208199 RepID=UPI001884327A|nr:flagellin [Pseudalkalibacillus hwajinpoensis]MBF0705139.1 flagellin [Pseudalkalibacillus hwajinpoensis]